MVLDENLTTIVLQGFLILEITEALTLSSVLGFASTRVVTQEEHKLLRQHFGRVLDKWGVRGLGWEIMDEFFRRCPNARVTFDPDDSEDESFWQGSGNVPFERDSIYSDYGNLPNRKSTGGMTLGAAKSRVPTEARTRLENNRKEPIALQDHVVFYVSFLHRCVRQLDDTRTILGGLIS